MTAHEARPSPAAIPGAVFARCSDPDCAVPVWRPDHPGAGWTSLDEGVWQHVDAEALPRVVEVGAAAVVVVAPDVCQREGCTDFPIVGVGEGREVVWLCRTHFIGYLEGLSGIIRRALAAPTNGGPS